MSRVIKESIVRVTTIVILFLVAHNSVVLGQNDGADGNRARLTFSCLYFEGRPSEELYYQNGEEFIKLDLPSGVRSREYPLQRVDTFSLFIFPTLFPHHCSVSVNGK